MTRRWGSPLLFLGALLLSLPVMRPLLMEAATPAENISPFLRPAPPLQAPAVPATPLETPASPTSSEPPPATTPAEDVSNPTAEEKQRVPSPEERRAIENAQLKALIEKGVFPPDMLERTTPLTRAEWATILVKALKHNTQLFSMFPFYRDVPLNHPAYASIEVARAKKLLVYPEGHGFYRPETPITYAKVYQGIAHALTGPPPSSEMVEHLLQPFEDKSALTPESARSVAKMARVYFFTDQSGLPTRRLDPEETVTPAGAAPLVSYLMHVIANRTDVNRRETSELPILPAGLTLTISPSTAVMESQLTPGQTVYFLLANPVAPLPKESRLKGVVRDVDLTQHRYELRLIEAHTPEDELYQMQATLTLAFPPRRRTPFIVPGQLFETTTQVHTVINSDSAQPLPAPSPSAPMPKD